MKGNIDIIKLLIKSQADPYIFNLNKFAPIHEAVFYSNFEAYLLLEFTLNKLRI